MVFVTTTTGDLIKQAEEIEMAKNIEKYLRNISIVNENMSESDGEEHIYSNYTIENLPFSDTGLTNFNIYTKKDDDFLLARRCARVEI